QQPIMDRAISNGFEYYTRSGSPEALEALFERMEDANTAYLMEVVSGVFQEGDEGEAASDNQLSLKHIQSQIDRHSDFISYKLADNQLIARIVTRESAEARKWEIDRPGLDASLRALLLEVKQNPGLGAYGGSQAAQKCYDILVKPIEPWLAGHSR